MGIISQLFSPSGVRPSDSYGTNINNRIGASSSYDGNYGLSDTMDFLGNAVKAQDTSGSNTFLGGLGSLFSKAVTAWDDYVGNTANRENIAYQKEYNEQVFNRADTQYQRTVADLRAAGLSSQLAAGAPSTVAGQSAAPQRTVGNESQAIERLIGMITLMKKTNADVNLINAQTDKVRTDDAIAQKQLAGFDEYRQTELAVMGSSIALNNAYTQNAMKEGEYIASRNLAAIGKDLSTARHNDALVSLVKKQIQGVDSQIALNKSQIAMNRSNVDLNRSRISLNSSQTALNYALEAYKEKEGKYLDKEIDYLASKIVTESFTQRYIDSETLYTQRQMVNAALHYVIDYSTFKFNVDRGDSPTATQVSSTQRAEAKREFLRGLALQGVSTLTSVISGVAGGLGAGMALGFGRGAGSMFFDKMRGMDEHPAMGFHP